MKRRRGINGLVRWVDTVRYFVVEGAVVHLRLLPSFSLTFLLLFPVHSLLARHLVLTGRLADIAAL